MSNKKCVISMSGGLDSTCLAMTMLARGYEVKAYGFKYGQKHSIELDKVKTNVAYLSKIKNLPISFQEIDLTNVFNESASSLCGDGGDIPEGHYEDENMKSTVVENRNVIFASIIYSKALAWSKRTNSDVVITLGLHAGDHCVYPDTTKESQKAVAKAFKVSNWGSDRISYIAPFNKIDKGEVLKSGIKAMKKLKFNDDEIDLVLFNTISCYNPNEKGESCGKCGTCTERLEAFEKAGRKDPIKYQEIQ